MTNIAAPAREPAGGPLGEADGRAQTKKRPALGRAFFDRMKRLLARYFAATGLATTPSNGRKASLAVLAASSPTLDDCATKPS